MKQERDYRARARSRRNSWKFPAFNKFEQSATTCGNVGNRVPRIGHFYGRQGIAATSHGKGCGLGDAPSQMKGSSGKGMDFEDANRAVPENGASLSKRFAEPCPRDRTDIGNHLPVRNVIDRDNTGRHILPNFFGDHNIIGQQRTTFFSQSFRFVEHRRLNERPTNVFAGCGQECRGDGTANNQRVGEFGEPVKHAKLGADFRSANDCHEWSSGVVE